MEKGINQNMQKIVKITLNVLFIICITSCNGYKMKEENDTDSTVTQNETFYTNFKLKLEDNLKSQGFTNQQTELILNNINLVISSSSLSNSERAVQSISSSNPKTKLGSFAGAAVSTIGDSQAFGQTPLDKEENLKKITKSLNSALTESFPATTSKSERIEITKEVSKNIFNSAIDEIQTNPTTTSELVISSSIEMLIPSYSSLEDIKNISNKISESVTLNIEDRNLSNDDKRCDVLKGVAKGPAKAFETLQIIDSQKIAQSTSIGIKNAISVIGENINITKQNNCIQEVVDHSITSVQDLDLITNENKINIISETSKGAIFGASNIKGLNSDNLINITEIVAVTTTEKITPTLPPEFIDTKMTLIARSLADALSGVGVSGPEIESGKNVLQNSIAETVSKINLAPYSPTSFLSGYTPNCESCDLPVKPKFSYSASITVEVDKFLTTIRPVVEEGSITSCSVTPSLPSGLILGKSCEIFGYPTATSFTSNYIVKGENRGGAFETTVSISVLPVAEKFSQISAGNSFSCGITEDAKLKCWGSNHHGQLGIGNKVENMNIVSVDESTNFIQVEVSFLSACALTVNFKLKCWGSNIFGTLGNGLLEESLSPITIDESTNYLSISSGRSEFCGITTSGVLKCWGDNYYGEIGIGTIGEVNTPTIVDPGINYKKVAINGSRICGITTSDELKCWGNNDYGSVGDGTTTNRTAPVLIDSGVGYSDIALGQQFTCGITISNQRKCWGSNSQGAWFGNNGFASSDHSSPIVVESSTEFDRIFGGETHMCGITSGNQLKCWGSNSFGEVGDGKIITVKSPLSIDNGTNYQDLSLGEYYSCGINSYGRVKCWGRNLEGQLGRGESSILKTPTLSISENKFKKISIGSFYSCGIDINSKVLCWGMNSHGEVGYGNYDMFSYPKQINDISSYYTVSANQSNTCGLTLGKTIKCWGFNGLNDMTFGGSSPASTLLPLKIFENQFFKDLSTGDMHRCALNDNGQVFCWGDNSYGQIGNSNTNYQSSPVAIDTGTQYKRIKAGAYYSCGITTSDQLKCWGNIISGMNFLSYQTPTEIMPGITVKDFASADNSGIFCAIDLNGSLYCIGELEGGYTEAPTMVDSSETYTQISGNAQNFCAITSAKRVKCWGSNYSGQLGNGTSTDSSSPSLISDTTQYQEVGVGEIHACGITINGSIKCWGRNSEGQLGISLRSEFSPQYINN
jgi:alpha-tubulin suppressor-like RCC1 family protein